MTAFRRALGSTGVVVVTFAVVTLGATAAFESQIEFSLLVGLPLGIYAGVTLAITTAAGLRYRADRLDGSVRKSTRRRVRAAVAATLALVCGGAVGAVVYVAVDGTMGLQILLFGLPLLTAGVGLLGFLTGE